MELDHDQKRTLRERGWDLLPPRSRRPQPVAASDVLEVGEDVRMDESEEWPYVIPLDSMQ
jgi:hypothetical protein